MKRTNGYMMPKTSKRVKSKYFCAMCNQELQPKDAYSYIDSDNFAITENSKAYCCDCCYRVRYGG